MALSTSSHQIKFVENGPYFPIVHLPESYQVLDLTTSEQKFIDEEWSIGRYDEIRPGLYSTEMFEDKSKVITGYSGVRDLHIGIDIGGPVDTPIHSWREGVVLHAGYNPAPGDYGNVIITEHEIDGVAVYSLYGHLNANTLLLSPVGRKFAAGEVLGGFGGRHENGGWAPHVHFQLSIDKPETHDLPGVVARQDREAALISFPDPRLVLGDIY